MSPERELARLYDEHAAVLFAFLLNLTRNEADTRDLLRGIRDERHFLLRLTHNAAIDLMRRRSTRGQRNEIFSTETLSPFAPTADPDEQAFRTALAESLGELPPDQRAADVEGDGANVHS